MSDPPVVDNKMQKLVSVYLDVTGYERQSGIRLNNSDIHGRVQEHLGEYLSAGWKIVHLSCMRGTETGGWIVVTLEKV